MSDSKLESGPRPVETVATANPAQLSEAELVERAVEASDAEAQLSFKELFRNYRPAILWSAALSLALVMEGMDVGLINNFFAHPAYLDHFGWPNADGEPHISATWQGAIGAGNNVGSVLGLLLNGFLQSRYGSRRVYMFAMCLMACTIFILFFAQSVEMLLAGNIICGIPWGIFQTLTTAYAAEITPSALRGYLTAWVSMCWGCGSFLATVILRASLQLDGNAGWKVPYALQWAWIPPLFTVAFFCPESPWYLVRRGRLEDAEKSLRRLARTGHYDEQRMAETMALMKHTNEQEMNEAANASYRDCFRGSNARRTGIVCLAWVVQMLNGQSMTQYAAIMLRSIGMSANMAFTYNMAIQSTNLVTTGIAIVLMGRVGRRIFFLFGSSGIGFFMLITGILGFALQPSQTAIAVAAILIIVQCIFKISLGPATYVVVGEMSSSRVRAQTIVIGRAIYVCCGLIVQQINPRMLNKGADAWNLGAKSGMVWFVMCFIWLVLVYFFLPETKNRAFIEIDYLFQKKVPARQFTSYPVDLFEFAPAQGANEKVREIEHERAATPVQVEEADKRQ